MRACSILSGAKKMHGTTLAGDAGGLFRRNALDPLRGLEVELDPEAFIRRIDQADGVVAVAFMWGMPRSEKRIVTWCSDSDTSDRKSHCMVPMWVLVRGSRFCL